ncbi:MAG TPA: hypothetical protein VMQ63_08485 [Stellaceae bacterium]|nr:hypothetical protein [Stellaceae bacterium]
MRLKPDSVAEAAQQRYALYPGTLYIYPYGFVPAPEQLIASSPYAPPSCATENGVTYCLVTPER